jgi:hypothetical protein
MKTMYAMFSSYPEILVISEDRAEIEEFALSIFEDDWFNSYFIYEHYHCKEPLTKEQTIKIVNDKYYETLKEFPRMYGIMEVPVI